MVGKKKVDEKPIDDIDLDGTIEGFEDMDGLDVDDLEMDEGVRDPSTVSAAKDLAKEAGSGFINELIKSTAKQSLPASYSENYYEAMDYADFGKEVLQKNVSKVKGTLYNLGKEVKKVLPFHIGLLDNFLQRYEEDNERFAQQTEEQIREASIASSLNNIFDKQLEVQKALEARHSAEDQIEKSERITTTKLNLDMLSSIESNIANSTAFSLQITKEYYRKSLELQYKSYFVLVDQLKTTRDYFKGFSVQFDSIVKNTSLPDFVKLRDTERLKEIMRTEFTKSVYSAAFDNNKYVQSVKDRFSKLISNKVNDFTEGLGGATEFLSFINNADMGDGQSSFGRLLGVAAGMGGETIGGKIAKKIAPNLKEKIADNKYINIGGNWLEALANSPKSLFRSMATRMEKGVEEYSDEGDPGRWLMSKLYNLGSGIMEVTKPQSINTKLEDTSILDHDKAAIFDNNVHRSITEVIPMYLSKILRSSTNLFKAYKWVNNETLSTVRIKDNKDGSPVVSSSYTEESDMIYDWANRKLDTKSNVKSQIENNLLSKRDQKSKHTDIASDLTSVIRRSMYQSDMYRATDEETLKLKKQDENILSRDSTRKALTKYLKILEGNKIKLTVDNILGFEKLDNADVRSYINNNPHLKHVLDDLNRISKDSILSKEDKKRVDDRIEDKYRLHPIEPIKEVFKAVNLLANNAKTKGILALSDGEAEIISKLLRHYKVTSAEQTITPEVIISGRAFAVSAAITREEFDKVSNKITIFIHDVNKVYTSPDGVTSSKLLPIIGALDTALSIAPEISIEIANTLRKILPFMSKEVSPGFRFEGKIETSADRRELDSRMTTMDINNQLKADYKNRYGIIEQETRKESNLLFDRTISAFNSISNRAKTNLDEYTQIFSEFKDKNKSVSSAILNSGNLIKQLGSTATTQVKGSMDKLKNSLKTNIVEAVDRLIEKNAPKAKEALLNYLITNKAKLDELIEKQKNDHKTKQEAINALMTNIKDRLDDKAIEKLEKIRHTNERSYEQSKLALDKISDRIKTMITNISNIKVEGKTIEDSGKTLMQGISAEYTILKNVLSSVVDDFEKKAKTIDDQHKAQMNSSATTATA